MATKQVRLRIVIKADKNVPVSKLRHHLEESLKKAGTCTMEWERDTMPDAGAKCSGKIYWDQTSVRMTTKAGGA